MSRLPSHPLLVKFGSGRSSYSGFISRAFWLMAYAASLQSHRMWSIFIQFINVLLTYLCIQRHVHGE